MEQQAAVLCKWVSQQQQKCDGLHHEAHKVFCDGIRAFKDEVKQVLQVSFEEYQADIAPPPPVNEDELFKELNAGLQARLDDLEPEQVPVFQKVQGVVQSLSSEISPGKQAILTEKLGAVFEEVRPKGKGAHSNPHSAQATGQVISVG